MSGKDWVRARAACSVETTLLELLVLVEHDVGVANELDAEVRADYTFEAISGTGRFTVRTAREGQGDFRDQRFVTFESRDEGILVFSGAVNNPHKPKPAPEFLIVPRWDTKKGKCELLIDGKPCELWQISQRALAGLFSFSWRERES